MRFKAKLAQDQVQLLNSIIGPLSKISGNNNNNNQNQAVVYLDRDYVRISIKDENGITCFAELSNNMLFMEHRIESAADNVILCQIDLLSWKLALQSITSNNKYQRFTSSASASGGGGGAGAGFLDNNNNPNNSNRRSSGGRNSSGSSSQNNNNNNNNSIMNRLSQPLLIMKLAKRNTLPCLCLEGSNNRHYYDIYQAIPVRILRTEEMKFHLPPAIPTPTVQLEIPMSIRPMVDKLKQLGQHLYIQGSMAGDLTIRYNQEAKASVACFYNQLIARWDEEEDDDENDDDNGEGNHRRRENHRRRDLSQTRTTIKVDSNKLATCLNWQQPSLPVSSCLLGMVPNEMLVLHVVLNPERVGFFTYYLPVYYLDPEDEEQLLS